MSWNNKFCWEMNSSDQNQSPRPDDGKEFRQVLLSDESMTEEEFERTLLSHRLGAGTAVAGTSSSLTDRNDHRVSGGGVELSANSPGASHIFSCTTVSAMHQRRVMDHGDDNRLGNNMGISGSPTYAEQDDDYDEVLEHIEDDSSGDMIDSIDHDFFPGLVTGFDARSDDDDSLDGYDSDSASSEDMPQESEEELKKPHIFPPDNLNMLKALRKRELGLGSSNAFRIGAYGSIGLVRRMASAGILEKHNGCVNGLNFNSTGELIASGSDDLKVVIWHWQRGVPYYWFDSGHTSNVFMCKFVPYCNDTHLITCARDGQIRMAELSSTGICKATKRIAIHKGSAKCVATLCDSSHVIYSCSEDASVYSIDLRQNRPSRLSITKNDEGKKVGLNSVHAHPVRSHQYCVAAQDSYVRVYDSRFIKRDRGRINHYTPLIRFHVDEMVMSRRNKYSVTCAVYSNDGSEILATYNDEDIYLFDADIPNIGSYVQKYSGHRNSATVKGVNFYGYNNEFVVSGSDCGNVFIWDKVSGQTLNYFKADESGVVNVLEPHPTSPILATSGLDHSVKIWMPTAKNCSNNEELKKLKNSNWRNRFREAKSHGPSIDGPLMMMLMQHLQRSSRFPAVNTFDFPSDSDSDENDDADDVGCNQS